MRREGEEAKEREAKWRAEQTREGQGIGQLLIKEGRESGEASKRIKEKGEAMNSAILGLVKSVTHTLLELNAAKEARKTIYGEITTLEATMESIARRGVSQVVGEVESKFKQIMDYWSRESPVPRAPPRNPGPDMDMDTGSDTDWTPETKNHKRGKGPTASPPIPPPGRGLTGKIGGGLLRREVEISGTPEEEGRKKRGRRQGGDGRTKENPIVLNPMGKGKEGSRRGRTGRKGEKEENRRGRDSQRRIRWS